MRCMREAIEARIFYHQWRGSAGRRGGHTLHVSI
jgi:hypothetical protein